FEDYLKLDGQSDAEAALAGGICEAFETLHAFEEQVLYPEIRESNKIVARSLARSDRKIAMQIAFIRAASDARRGRAVIELIEFFHAKVCTCEQFVFPFGQWRVPADPLSGKAGAGRRYA